MSGILGKYDEPFCKEDIFIIDSKVLSDFDICFYQKRIRLVLLIGVLIDGYKNLYSQALSYFIKFNIENEINITHDLFKEFYEHISWEVEQFKLVNEIRKSAGLKEKSVPCLGIELPGMSLKLLT